MSKKVSKTRNSQIPIGSQPKWTPNETLQLQNFMRVPPRQPFQSTLQQFSSTAPDFQQHFNEINFRVPITKPSSTAGHQRRQSSFNREQNQQEFQEIGMYNVRSQQVTPKLKRKMSQPRMSDYNDQIEDRLKQIQSLMGVENDNLRQQKDFLLKTIHQMQQKQKQYKAQVQRQKSKITTLESQNQLLREKYEKARQFISTGIGKIEQFITKQQKQDSYQNTKTTQNSINTGNQLQQLSDKFDALMYQYQKTRKPEVRKQCMEVAVELKKLRRVEAGLGGSHGVLARGYRD